MDRITLYNIRAFGRHGAYAAERERVQPFDITVALQLDLSRARISDDLSDTLDYARLHARLVGIVENASYALLERLAAELLAAVLDDPRVASAEVTVAKPGILRGATPAVTVRGVRTSGASP